MRVLTVGSDRLLFQAGSAVASRVRAYGERFGLLDIIVFTQSGYQTTALDAHTKLYPTRSLHKLFYMFDAVVLGLRLPRPDVITVQDPFESGLVGLVLSLMRRVPLHVQIHTDPFSPYFVRVSFLNRMRRVLMRIILLRASRVRVVAERTKDALAKIGVRASVTLLPIYVPVEELKKASPFQEVLQKFSGFATKLLVVARLEGEKRVDRAIDAFAESAPKDACLIIVGEGRERAYLEARIKEKGISTRVFFEGARPSIEYYKVADLVLVPSDYEGYGMVIVEALASGVPVLATDVGVAREAGAIVSTYDNFSAALADWFKNHSPDGTLHGYPYTSFEEYVSLYCADIEATWGD